MARLNRLLCVVLAAAMAVSCGGGGGDSAPIAPPANASPGGIWTTQYVEAAGPAAGDQINVRAIVTESGDLFFAGIDATNGCASVGFGQLAVNGTGVSGSVSVAIVRFATGSAVNTNCTYSDGSTYGTGTLSGTVNERVSMTITETAATSMGLALPVETHSWAFSPLYNLASSFATIAGNYADGTDTLTIDANGVIFEQDPTTNCIINGQASIINAAYNAYGISFTFAGCTGSSIILNGLTANGLAYFDNTLSPNQLLSGLKLVYNGQTLVVAGALTKM